MKLSKRKPPILSIALYILAATLVLYAIWAMINCHEYISKLIVGKQLVASGNEYSIASYYMTNCVQYILYAIAFILLGKIYHKMISNLQPKSPQTPEQEEKELSAFFLPDDKDKSSDTDEFSKWKSSRL
jgi:hypothetical protein